MDISSYIKTHIDLNYNEKQLPFTAKEKRFAKNSILTDYEVIEENIFFLKSGIVQVEINYNDVERILDFFFPYTFFCSYTSLLKSVPSDVKIVALNNCVVDVIKHTDLLAAYEHSLMANKLGRIESEKLYLRKVKHEKDLMTKSAEVRYGELLTEQPEIIKQIPINRISQYLGVRPESLSRIRKSIS